MPGPDTQAASVQWPQATPGLEQSHQHSTGWDVDRHHPDQQRQSLQEQAGPADFHPHLGRDQERQPEHDWFLSLWWTSVNYDAREVNRWIYVFDKKKTLLENKIKEY